MLFIKSKPYAGLTGPQLLQFLSMFIINNLISNMNDSEQKFKLEPNAKIQDCHNQYVSTKMIIAPLQITKDKNIQPTQKPAKLNKEKKALRKLQKSIVKKEQTHQPKMKRPKVQQIRWKPFEDIGYIKFLKDYPELFSNQNIRRTGKVFLKLSIAIGGARTPNQCKSHHQKMQKVTKTGSIAEVVQYLQNKYRKTKSTEALLKQMLQTKADENKVISASGHLEQIIENPLGLEVKVFLREDLIEQW